jgi:hypothetical protein
MSEDQRLLREFTQSASRQALEELIRPPLPLVYSASFVFINAASRRLFTPGVTDK